MVDDTVQLLQRVEYLNNSLHQEKLRHANDCHNLEQKIFELNNPPVRCVRCENAQTNPQTSETFFYTKNGSIQETIANGYFNNVLKISLPGDRMLIHIKVIIQGDNNSRSVLIDQVDLSPKNLIDQLRIQASMSFTSKYSKTKLGEIMLNLLTAFLNNAPILDHALFQGWNHNIDNDSYKFLSSVNSKIDNLPISKKILHVPETTAVNALEFFVSSLQLLTVPAHKFIMIGWIIYSVLFTLFDHLGIRISKILVINDMNYGYDFLKCFLQVFEADDDTLISSTGCDPNILENLIYENKDETLVLLDCDDKNSDKNKKQLINLYSQRYQAQMNRKNDNPIKIQSTLAICSNTIFYEYSSEFFLILDLSKKADWEMFLSLTNSNAMISDNIYHFIKYCESNYGKCINLIHEQYKVNCQKALGYQFEKKSTVEAFSILTTSIELFELYCKENNINLAMDEVFDQIAEHMKNGECISDLEGIVDLFKDCIISLVSSDHLNLLPRKSRNKILKKNPAYPTLFYDEEHIYLSRDDLIQYIIPMYSIDIIPDDILHALKEEGYLCTYNMGKFTYEVKPTLYDECGMKRCSMIKISRNLFDEVGSFSIFDGGDI